MRYVTIQMIAEHAKKTRQGVLKALKTANVETEKCPGCHGLRIKERDANTFLQRQWPQCGALPSL